MSRAAHHRLFSALTALLLVLHVDVWNAEPRATLVFGWLPWDLAYHLLWMVGATVLVGYMCSPAIWPEDQDPPAPEDAP